MVFISSFLAISDISANIITTYDYDAYGNVSLTSGSQAFQNDRLFTGREYEKETGLYYYRARFYSPKTGRFLSRDPIGIQDDVNLYAYVGNNPVMFTDPSGEAAVVGAAISVGLGVTIAAIEYNSTGEWNYSLMDAAIDAGAGFVGAGIGAKAMQLGPLFGPTIDTGVTIGLSKLGEKYKSCSKTHTQPGNINQELISYGAATAFGALGTYGKLFKNVGLDKPLGNKGFVMLTNNVNKTSEDIKKIAEKITKKYDNLQCEPCYKALMKTFKKNGINGEIIKLDTSATTRNIISDTFGVDKSISESGIHYATKIGDTVFDNIHKKGIEFSKWKNDLGLDTFIKNYSIETFKKF